MSAEAGIVNDHPDNREYGQDEQDEQTQDGGRISRSGKCAAAHP